jgi:LysM repeat protein
MRRRSHARFLAPVALVTCAVAVYAVVHNGTKSQGRGTTHPASTSDASRTTTAAHPKGGRKAKTYTVKSGDVLSAIAITTGTSVTELERLNPDMDAATLHPGQKLKLP